MSQAPHLLLLCHSGSWDRLYQAFSAAGAATAQGRRVDLVFFFDALDRLLRDELNEVRLEGASEEASDGLEERAVEIGTRPLGEMLAAARRTGLTRLFACSASTALTGHDPDATAARVDEVIGWPTVIRLMESATSILYI